MKKALFVTILLTIASLPVYSADVNLNSPVVPHRVYDMSTGELIDFEQLLLICADADVVTQGEQHGDPATHRMELAFLYGLNRLKDGKVALSMEMFERDQQEKLDGFLSGEINEDEFESSTKLSSTYERDYRPLIRFCKRAQLPVIAANLPWDMGIQIAIKGVDTAYAEMSDEEKEWMAESWEVKDGVYRERHSELLISAGAHGMGMELTEDFIYRYYQGHSLKDDTMAESVVRFADSNPGFTVYQIVGSFHVNDHLGLYEKIESRMPDGDIVLVMILPVTDISAPLESVNNPYSDEIQACDYLILVPDYRTEDY